MCRSTNWQLSPHPWSVSNLGHVKTAEEVNSAIRDGPWALQLYECAGPLSRPGSTHWPCLFRATSSIAVDHRVSWARTDTVTSLVNVIESAHYDVAIVGAGLAGLRAAQILSNRGLRVVIVEQSDHVGGRVHSFNLDGFVIDNGFQLINPAYPELRATGVVASLELRSFPGLLTYVGVDGEWTLADPRRWPLSALGALLRGHPRPIDAWRLARLFANARFTSAQRLANVPDRSTRQGFLESGLRPEVIDQLLVPFLQGTLLESELETSWRYTRLLIKSFASGRPGTPINGARQLPLSLVASAPNVELRLSETVRSLTSRSLRTGQGDLRARAVLVATDQDQAARLLGQSGADDGAGWRATTTWWFSTPRVQHGDRLRLDQRPGAISSMLDLASVAPERAPKDRSLIAVAVNGLHDERRDGEMATDVARFYGLARADVELLTRTPVAQALPRMTTPLDLTKSSRRGDVFVSGDYLQTPSIQGALVSGRRAGVAILQSLGLEVQAPRSTSPR